MDDGEVECRLAPMTFEAPHERHGAARHRASELGLGFLYWLGFVLMLEPGNLLHGLPSSALAWDRELLRLLGAGLLGGVATPFILRFARRWPIGGARLAGRLGAHVIFAAALAVILIAVSCVLAPLLPGATRHPLGADIGASLVSDGPLVLASIGVLDILAHAIGGAGEGRRLIVRAKGHFARLDLSQVAWIETQGNYLALHGPSGAQLVRGTAKSIEGALDPARFVRIHRRAIVAVDAIDSVTPLAAGDALLSLNTGQRLRVSRGRRPRLWRALAKMR